MLLRALWSRRGLSAAVLLVGALTMGAAALGPVYARAAGESTLRDALTQADSAAGLQFEDHPFGYELTAGAGRFDTAQAKAPAPGSIRGYPDRIGAISVQTGAAQAPGVSGVKTAMVWRANACAHLMISSGRCPAKPGEGLVSLRTVHGGYGWRLGGRIVVGIGIGAQLTIVGTYTPLDPDDTFWFGRSYFDAAPGNSGPDTVDAVFVVRTEFDAIPPDTDATLSWDFPLDPSSIRLDDVPQLRRDIAALTSHYAAVTSDSVVLPGPPPEDLEFSTGLPTVLDAAARERRLVNTGTLLVTLQLSLLAWLVLFEVVTDAIESRGNEIALAKLRGLRTWPTVRFALGEVIAMLAVAMPIGLGLAWAGAQLFSDAVLVPGTPAVLTWYAVAALVAAFAGGLVAAAAGSYRALTRSVLAQWRRTARSVRASRVGLVIDVVLSGAAIAGLVLLRAHHHPGNRNDSAALLAPGLLVVAVALLGTRLVPVAARGLLGPTRASGRIGLFLAARQVARRPAGLRLAALLAVAVGLATFGVSGEAVATSNRSARARAEVGADRVVAMQFVRGVDPVDAVRAADPDGRWAMAAATWLPDGGDSVVGTVLAVDSRRMAAVGDAAVGGPSSAQIASTISASAVPEIITTATAVRATITASAIRGTAPQVQFMFRTAGDPFLSVSAGRLAPGTHTYAADVPCHDGCTLLGLTWSRTGLVNETMSGTVVIAKIEQLSQERWSGVPALLSQAGAWRPGPEFSESTDTLDATPGGLRDEYRSASGYGGVSYAYDPVPLPAVATRAGVISGPTAPSPLRMGDGFGISATFEVKAWADVLPIVLDNGLIVDLEFLRAQLPAFDNEGRWMILLGRNAPSDALARLRSAGLTLQNVRTTHTRIVELGRQAPALSLFLLLACAIIGALVAVGGTAIAIRASARRRSFETAALRAIGVSRGSVYRGGVLEQVLLLGAAVLLGVPAGGFAARLTMPVIPEFTDSTPILLRYRPPLVAIAGFAVGFAVLVCLTSAVAALAVVRAARPSRLREAEE